MAARFSPLSVISISTFVTPSIGSKATKLVPCSIGTVLIAGPVHDEPMQPAISTTERLLVCVKSGARARIVCGVTHPATVNIRLIKPHTRVIRPAHCPVAFIQILQGFWVDAKAERDGRNATTVVETELVLLVIVNLRGAQARELGGGRKRKTKLLSTSPNKLSVVSPFNTRSCSRAQLNVESPPHLRNVSGSLR